MILQKFKISKDEILAYESTHEIYNVLKEIQSPNRYKPIKRNLNRYQNMCHDTNLILFYLKKYRC